MRLRCLIVDDNAAFRAASRLLLEREGLHVVGVAANASACLERVEKLRPDIVLVDVDLGEDSGFDVAHQLAQAPRTGVAPRVIFISTHAEHDYAELVADSQAVGFLNKSVLSRDAIESMLRSPTSAPAGQG